MEQRFSRDIASLEQAFAFFDGFVASVGAGPRDVMPLARSTVSPHLKVLEEAGRGLNRWAALVLLPQRFGASTSLTGVATT